MEVKLIVVGGDAKTTEIDLKLPTVIGRGRGATLTLPHPLVSRQHCEIYEAEGQLYVRDLGSLNGTFIGNEPISEAVLPAGELLTVGAVTFRAIYGELLDQERRGAGSTAAPKRTSPSTRTVRSEAVETVSQPHARTAKEAPRRADSTERGVPVPLPGQPAAAPEPPVPEGALATEDEAELVQFHEEFEAVDEVIVVEEEGIDSDLPGAPLFTGAEEEVHVIDDVLPEGSTFDSAKPLHQEDTRASLPRHDASVELDEVDVVEDVSPSQSDDLLPLTSPPPGSSPLRNMRGNEAADPSPNGTGAKPPSSSPEGKDDELQKFLRNQK
jgi:hypothetical protein